MHPESPLALSSRGLGVGRMLNPLESTPAQLGFRDWTGKSSDPFLESEPSDAEQLRSSKSVGEKIV